MAHPFSAAERRNTLAAMAMARDACSALSPAQRIAFAIELVRDIDDPGVDFHLLRLGNQAIAQSNAIRREAMVANGRLGGRAV